MLKMLASREYDSHPHTQKTNESRKTCKDYVIHLLTIKVYKEADVASAKFAYQEPLTACRNSKDSMNPVKPRATCVTSTLTLYGI